MSAISMCLRVAVPFPASRLKWLVASCATIGFPTCSTASVRRLWPWDTTAKTVPRLFMLNLMRGAGIAGLTSMRPQSGNVVRPLLPFTRREIEDYVAQHGLTFINDSSNASDAHRRNRLRNNIFPALEAAFPGALDAVLRTVANLESAGAIYREGIEQKRRLYFMALRSALPNL